MPRPSKPAHASKPSRASRPSKASSPAAAATPAKPQSAKVDARLVGKCADLVGGVRQRLPALTPVERQARKGRFGKGRCEQLGTKTQSRNVLKDATDWVIAIDKALARSGHSIKRYSGRRLAWFADCVLALAQAIEAQDAAQGKTGVTQAALGRAQDVARRARTALVASLEAIPGDDDAREKEALTEALGATRNPDELAESLSRLAELASTWLARHEGVWRVQVEDAGLAKADVDAARAAAEALSVASRGKTLDGRAMVHDTPAVNEAEGRVLLEMKDAMTAFADAHEADASVPKLVPGPGTRHVVARPRSRAAATNGAPAPAPAG